MNKPTEPSSTFSHAVLWYGRELADDDRLLTDLIASAGIIPIDQLTVNGAELTAKELTGLRQFASRSPHGASWKLLLIRHADQLSIVVANGLLKLIEEPPPHLLIRLNADQATAVLSTIRSRCQSIFVGRAIQTDHRYPLADVDAMPLIEQLKLAETLASDNALPLIVTDWLASLEIDLLRGEPVDASIALGQTLLERLGTSANRRLALEAWFVARFVPTHQS